jgi:hypothetical protein
MARQETVTMPLERADRMAAAVYLLQIKQLMEVANQMIEASIEEDCAGSMETGHRQMMLSACGIVGRQFESELKSHPELTVVPKDFS